MHFHLTIPGLALVVGTTAAMAGGPSGACDLLTRQEAAAALGKAVPTGTEAAMDIPLLGASVPAQFCMFGSEVVVARYELGADASALFAKYRQSLAGQDGYRSVSGVGDEAFVAKGQLAVRKGKTGLIVDVGQARGGGAPEEKAEAGLAKLAVGRL
jgi:hypothetical protein